jgi:hypothetical protein
MADAGASRDSLKVFISYSRRDMATADALVTALEGTAFEVTIDRRDLPYGEEWQKELADFIRGSDTVVWLVSPDSVKSPWCNWELGEVGRLNKRLVPVKIRHVVPEELPEALGKIHLLPVEGVYAAEQHFATLVATLNADRGWIKEATRLADRAREWIGRSRHSSLLLRGPALKNAEGWSTRRPKTVPPLASEVLELILASRCGAARRQRWAIGGALTVATMALGLAGFALSQWQRAETELRAAIAQRLAVEAQSALTASLQSDRPGAPDSQRGVLLALESLRINPNIQADGVLRGGLRRLSGSSLEVKLEEGDVLKALGPHAAWVAVRRGDTDVILDAKTRTFRAPTISEATLLKEVGLPRDEVTTIAPGVFAKSSDGRMALVESDKEMGDWILASLALTRVADNKVLAILPHEWNLREAFFRRDHRYLLTVTGRASMDASDASATRLVGSTVYVWEVPSGKKATEISFADSGGITHLAIDPENEWLAVQTSDASGEALIVMPIWPDLARSEACQRLTRNLSPSEWATLVAVGPRAETCPGLPITSE